MMGGQVSFIEAVKRANSHFRYWKYRRTLNGTGPTFLASCKHWYKQFIFQWLGIGGGA